ncbi:alpha/beta hydrolase [Marinomonas sp. PE14-40]|uniref:alpha/beta hydrolase n=1 Tax=Marinomonas sp. PE14-40 TaxID=3060621 RepID=UPI003F675CAF
MEKRSFLARDGVRLAYDEFSPEGALAQGIAANSSDESSRVCFIFLHGSTYNSRRYANIAKALSGKGYQTCLLNWRGHGESQGKPGDLHYVGQLEDDLADMIAHIKSQDEKAAIVIGGHSAGAVVCLRYIDKYSCDEIKAVAFVSPAINGPLETVRYPQPSSALQYKLTYFRQAKVHGPVPEAALQYAPILNMKAFWLAKLIPGFRHKPILSFPASERMAKLEGRVLDYSYNLMLSCDINDYPNAFNRIKVPTLMLVGEEDEVIHPSLLDTVFHWHLGPDLTKSLIKVPKLNHIRILPAACQVLPNWIASIFEMAVSNDQADDQSDESGLDDQAKVSLISAEKQDKAAFVKSGPVKSEAGKSEAEQGAQA